MAVVRPVVVCVPAVRPVEPDARPGPVSVLDSVPARGLARNRSEPAVVPLCPVGEAPAADGLAPVAPEAEVLAPVVPAVGRARKPWEEEDAEEVWLRTRSPARAWVLWRAPSERAEDAKPLEAALAIFRLRRTS